MAFWLATPWYSKTRVVNRVDPLGRLLLNSGALTEDALADVLDSQRQPLPFASLCYSLGHLDEETLVRGLSRQFGVPGVVFDRGVLALSALDGVSKEAALHHGVLPVYEDDRRVFVACDRPDAARELLRELEFIKGKAVVQHVALHITLARTIRTAYRALELGRSHLPGILADGAPYPVPGIMHAVSEVDPAVEGPDQLIGEVTKEIVDDDLLEIIDAENTATQDATLDGPTEGYSEVHTIDEPATGADTTESSLSDIELAGAQPSSNDIIDLDEGMESELGVGQGRADGVRRALVVDDDFATRHLLVKLLEPAGYEVAAASTGSEAVRLLKSDSPDIVVIDVMLPEIDGFQVCRSIKKSLRYKHIPVILMSAVIDSGRVTSKVLNRYGADAYFEKPLDTDRVLRRIDDLLDERGPTPQERDDGSFDEALRKYRAGSVDSAIDLLRDGLKNDPLSAKHHFVLANLLQKQALIYEAIDEYEATVDLKPDYFPALTRLAYLYYKKGFSAKAIETWRRSLQHCPDDGLRQNIEVFMRKLIADMQLSPT